MALITEFPARCLNWVDPEGEGITSYTFYYFKNDLKYTLATSLRNEIELILPYGTFDILVDISDLMGATTEVSLGILNTTLPDKETFDNFNVTDKMNSLSAIGDQAKLGMSVTALSSIRDNADWLALNIDSLANLTEEEVMGRVEGIADDINNQLDLTADTMDFSTLPQINAGADVVSSAIEGITKADMAAFTVDLDAREKSIDLLDKMTNQLSDVEISSPYELEPFMSKSINTMASLMSGLNKITSQDEVAPPSDLKDAPNMDYDVDPGDDINFEVPTDPDEMFKQNVLDTTAQRAKKQIDKMMNIVDAMSNEVQRRSVVGEVIKANSENGASIIVAKVTEEILIEGMTVNTGENSNASVKFPPEFCPSRYDIPDTDCRKILGLTTVLWPCITHGYPDSSKYLSDKTKIISVDVSINEEKVRVTNESSPFLLEIPKSPESIPEPIYVNVSLSLNQLTSVVYHRFEIVKPLAAITIEVLPTNSSDDIYSNMVLIIDHKRLPTLSNYLWMYSLSDFSKDENNTYSLFIDSETNDNRTGNFYAGFGAIKPNLEENPINLTKEMLMEDFDDYRVRIFVSGCYYFDDVKQSWFGDGLQVVSATPTTTVCKASHLTPFGGGFLPTPNEIDFDFVFANAGFIDNLTLYLVLIIITSTYLLMLIWTIYMDKKDIERRGVIPLPDNKSDDKYLYEITFYTGPDAEAATESNIKFILSGDLGETNIRVLPPSDRILYKRYAVNSFVFTTPSPLGYVNLLRIMHDNSGLPPYDTWQLEAVIIRDLQTGEKYNFITHTWLAFNRNDGRIDRTFKTNNEIDSLKFLQKLYIESNNSANSDHMWLSVFMRPPGSRFNRKERLSVCAVFLYVSMLFSALWYDTSPETPRSGFFTFGPFSLSTEQTIIGLVIVFCVIPLTLFLSFIFKRARPRKLKTCRALEAIKKQESEAEKNYETKFKQKNNSNSRRAKDTSSQKCIPWWTRIFAWIIIIALIGVSIFFVWSYGIMWGEIKTTKWFSSFITTFFISVVIAQWIKVIFSSFVSISVCKSDKSFIEDIDCDEEMPNLGYDEEWKYIAPMSHSKSRKIDDIQGVDYEDPEIDAMRIRLTKQRDMGFVLRGVMLYCLFLTVLLILVSGRTNHSAFLLQSHLTKTFIKPGHQTLDFSRKVSFQVTVIKFVFNFLILLQKLHF